MNIPKSVLIGAILLSLMGCSSSSTQTEKEILANCYHGQVGDSDSVIAIDDQAGSVVSGYMSFVFAQKDSSYGTFKGNFSEEKLKVKYTFWSEGIQSVGDYVFIKDGKNFTGQGYVYKPADDCEQYIKR